MAKKVERAAMTQTDSKGNVIREPKKDPLDLGKYTWWKAETDEDMALQVAGTLKFIERHQSQRNEQLTVSTRLYGNSTAFGFLGGSFTRASSTTPAPQTQRLSFNLCASIIDTLVSKIAKNEVTPTFITSGGVWGMQRKAENLSKFIDGMFYEHNVHKMISNGVGDCGIWGDALVHIYRTEDNKVGTERVVPHELFVDLIETIVGQPRQMHRVKTGDRDVFAEMFAGDKKAQEKILTAMPATSRDLGGFGSAADLITMTESWHLPSGPGATDGLHVICCEDKVVFREKYEKDYFPFAHLRYVKRPFGYWGQGACERLQNLQGEINRCMITIQKNLWMFAGTKIAVENGSKVVSQHLNNEVGSIYHFTDTPPSYVTPPAVHPEIYEWVETLIQKGYQQEGVSQLAASNLKPAGVDSGAALRTYDQISDDRQLFFEKRVEDFALEIARQMIEIVRDIHEDGGSYKVKWSGTNFIESIDWKDIHLKEDEYVLKAFPTSSLPDEPAAKLQTVQEYMQAGLISPRAGRRLLRMPDVEMSDKLANAAEELICKTIEDILYDKKIKRPDGNWDLQLAKQLSLEYYNFAVLNNCPEANLKLLRDFQAFVDDQLGLTAPPPAPGPVPAGAAASPPLANPTPTPISPLLPNVAGAA